MMSRMDGNAGRDRSAGRGKNARRDGKTGSGKGMNTGSVRGGSKSTGSSGFKSAGCKDSRSKNIESKSSGNISSESRNAVGRMKGKERYWGQGNSAGVSKKNSGNVNRKDNESVNKRKDGFKDRDTDRGRYGNVTSDRGNSQRSGRWADSRNAGNGKRMKEGVSKPVRKKSLCPVSRECGGCQMLDIDYSEQLKTKQKQIESLFKGICPVKPIVGMKDPFHYRNKVHAVFDRDRWGNIFSGIYQESSHDVVSVEKCMIEDEKADEIIGTIRGMLKSFKIRIYDEDTGFGLLRHVLVRRAFSTGEIMVVLVTASPVFPSKNNFIKALREKHPEITTIVQNINGRGTSMVLGDKEHVLYGRGYIVDELCGCKFRISSRSFYQINPVQTEVLYKKALELAGLTGKELVIDAYCGIGTIGIIASRQAGQVIGVELNQDAVRDAVSNARMNEAKNIKFYGNDAGRFLVNMAERGDKADVVIMDPPRSGSTEEFMDSIAKMGAGKVVYVSCNPETLARDVRYMGKLGYRAEAVWPVDMFPATYHVETVTLLVRKP